MATQKKSKSSAKTEVKNSLKADKRTRVGKATRMLRKEGILPANVYGKDFESQSIQTSLLEFRHVYTKARETGIVYIELEGKSIPCMIRNIQRHPVSGSILHADLRKINLKQKTEAEVPIKVIGESDAVKSQNGVLITQTETLTVESLPTDIPYEIEVDISSLKEIGDEIKVKDLKTTDKVIYKDDPETVILLVTAHREEDTEPDTTSEQAGEVTEKGEEDTKEEANEEAEKTESKE